MLYGNSPLVGTGYGVQIKHLALKLKQAGHDVAVACTYGHQVGIKDWPTEWGPIRLYPSGWTDQSLDVLAAHVGHFFDGDPQAGWIIPVTDMWCLNPVAKELAACRVLPWTPVDHLPVPGDVVKFFHMSGHQPVAMSNFGRREFYEAGLSPSYVPLAVDTDVFKPTTHLPVGGELVDARTVFNIPQDAFAVLMVAMNKDPQDRKNFGGAVRAFAEFHRTNPHAVLVLHTDAVGAAGSRLNLNVVAMLAGLPRSALIFTDPYAQRLGLTDEMLAGLYSACDVLLAPSKGEGFCVPMIEAQACGTPVIVSNFSAQAELVGAGWTVAGQLEFDPGQSSNYFTAFHHDIVAKLNLAARSDLVALSQRAVEFAQEYSVDAVWQRHWAPLIGSLEPQPPAADKPLMQRVDVIVPLVRDANRERLESSFAATAPLTARIIEGVEGRTYAENVNACLRSSTADWVLVVGDDVEFLPGWFEAAVALTDRYDVVGTNDSEPGRIRNPEVAAGRHADHFFVRRSYIDDDGASLDGSGSLISEGYGHWFADKELVELAKARNTFTPCLDARIVHHHPGYDGREDLRAGDPLYMSAVDRADTDRTTWLERVGFIDAERAWRAQR
jgi:glycosyltransferase involved in cell wall biosynthesis